MKSKSALSSHSRYIMGGIGEITNESVSRNLKTIEKRFLAFPSFLAGLSLGLNNFLLGLISDQGISSAYIFSVGAIYFAVSYRILKALLNKKKFGQYWRIQESNIFYENADNQICVNRHNVLGLFLRVFLNISF